MVVGGMLGVKGAKLIDLTTRWLAGGGGLGVVGAVGREVSCTMVDLVTVNFATYARGRSVTPALGKRRVGTAFSIKNVRAHMGALKRNGD